MLSWRIFYAFASCGVFAGSASFCNAQLDLKDILGGSKMNIPGLDKIPGLEGGVRTLLNDDALTTNIKDASNGLPFFDGFSPKRFISLSRLKHSQSGAFEMQPGAYAGVVRSYCLHAGTYGPTEGNGYLNAPLKGKRAAVVNKLLHIDTTQPGMPTQPEMQQLIWAVLSRGKYSNFSPNLREVGDKLLTPEERFELEGGAIGMIPEDIKQKLYNKLDSFLKPLVDAQIQMRSLVTQANIPFQSLEKVAVLAGEPPSHKDDRNVPVGRWLIQKNGIYTRYQPFGYSRTRIDTYVPERFMITTDSTGRIRKVEGPKDTGLEITYGDASLNTGSKELQGYPIASVKFSGDTLANLDNTGWTFTGATPRKFSGKDEGAFSGTQLRFQQAQQRQLQVNDVKKEFPRDKKTQGDWPVPEKVYNLLHLRDALANAYWSVQKTTQGDEVTDFLTKATMAELSDWVTGRQAASPLSVFASLTFGLALPLPEVVGYDQGDQVPEFDPSPNPAMPAHVYSQRIGMTTTVVSDMTFPGLIGGQDDAPSIKIVSLKAGDTIYMTEDDGTASIIPLQALVSNENTSPSISWRLDYSYEGINGKYPQKDSKPLNLPISDCVSKVHTEKVSSRGGQLTVTVSATIDGKFVEDHVVVKLRGYKEAPIDAIKNYILAQGGTDGNLLLGLFASESSFDGGAGQFVLGYREPNINGTAVGLGQIHMPDHTELLGKLWSIFWNWQVNAYESIRIYNINRTTASNIRSEIAQKGVPLTAGQAQNWAIYHYKGGKDLLFKFDGHSWIINPGAFDPDKTKNAGQNRNVVGYINRARDLAAKISGHTELLLDKIKL